MNEKLIAKVKKSDITGYKLSKKSGIPYTAISELLTGKKGINKKSSGNSPAPGRGNGLQHI